MCELQLILAAPFTRGEFAELIEDWKLEYLFISVCQV